MGGIFSSPTDGKDAAGLYMGGEGGMCKFDATAGTGKKCMADTSFTVKGDAGVCKGDTKAYFEAWQTKSCTAAGQGDDSAACLDFGKTDINTCLCKPTFTNSDAAPAFICGPSKVSSTILDA
jgi:hypothetical protein